jgi:hypothetical protein
MALTLIAFKIVTSVLIVWFFPSWTAVLIVVGLSALWILPLLYVVPRHFQGRYRLWNVRLRRRRLLQEEWRID